MPISVSSLRPRFYSSINKWLPRKTAVSYEYSSDHGRTVPYPYRLSPTVMMPSANPCDNYHHASRHAALTGPRIRVKDRQGPGNRRDMFALSC